MNWKQLAGDVASLLLLIGASIALLLFTVGNTGCVHDVARVQTSDDRVLELAHTSVLRRGCHELMAQDGKTTVSLTAQDLSASRELAAAGVVGAAAIAGPAGAGIAAAGAALSEAMGDERSEACTPVAQPPDGATP